MKRNSCRALTQECKCCGFDFDEACKDYPSFCCFRVVLEPQFLTGARSICLEMALCLAVKELEKRPYSLSKQNYTLQL